MTVVGVAWNGTDADMRSFERVHRLSFRSLRDDTGALFARFQVPVQPAWVFVGSDGRPDLHVGALEPPDLADRLTRLT